jgi:hypothetical protein
VTDNPVRLLPNKKPQVSATHAYVREQLVRGTVEEVRIMGRLRTTEYKGEGKLNPYSKIGAASFMHHELKQHFLRFLPQPVVELDDRICYNRDEGNRQFLYSSLITMRCCDALSAVNGLMSALEKKASP